MIIEQNELNLDEAFRLACRDGGTAILVSVSYKPPKSYGYISGYWIIEFKLENE